MQGVSHTCASSLGLDNFVNNVVHGHIFVIFGIFCQVVDLFFSDAPHLWTAAIKTVHFVSISQSYVGEQRLSQFQLTRIHSVLLPRNLNHHHTSLLLS